MVFLISKPFSLFELMKPMSKIEDGFTHFVWEGTVEAAGHASLANGKRKKYLHDPHLRISDMRKAYIPSQQKPS